MYGRMISAAPRFSVLLPTHDRPDVLGFAIESVLTQSEPDFELLIVADGCTASTAEVVGRFSDPRIRFFDLPKAPAFGYANRNIALREARGRLIALAAHDDLLFPDHLQRMGDLLDQSGVAWAYSRPLWVSTDGVIVPFGTNLLIADEYRRFQHHNTIPASCIVHTREILERVGFWPEDVSSAADWSLWKRMLAASDGRLAYQRRPTALHFSASWKKSRHSSSQEVLTLLHIADEAAWWPAILRQACTPMIPEQAGIWQQLRSGRQTWVDELRAAVDTVCDRLAWLGVCSWLPQLDQAWHALRSSHNEAEDVAVRKE
jgi:glycosyltransferase involved in cell wall biosynthesis